MSATNPKRNGPEEDEGLYEEYRFEGDYEKYGKNRKATRNARSIDETFCQKLSKKKW